MKVFNALKQHKEVTSMTTAVDAFQQYWKVLESTQTNFPYAVLVAGVLGSQTRDIVTIATTKALIEYVGGQLSPQVISVLPHDELLSILKKCNYCNMKTKYLINLSKQLIEKPDSISNLQGLLSLQGVGPKIAHLVLCVAYKQEEPCKSDIINKGGNGGIVVDTHVNRIASRIGLVRSSNKPSAEHTRIKLETIFHKDMWNELTVLLIGLGQSTCGASMPRCDRCPLHTLDLCSSSKQYILERTEKNKHKGHKKKVTDSASNSDVIIHDNILSNNTTIDILDEDNQFIDDKQFIGDSDQFIEGDSDQFIDNGDGDNDYFDKEADLDLDSTEFDEDKEYCDQFDF
jgi:endonuclease-3